MRKPCAVLAGTGIAMLFVGLSGLVLSLWRWGLASQSILLLIKGDFLWMTCVGIVSILLATGLWIHTGRPGIHMTNREMERFLRNPEAHEQARRGLEQVSPHITTDEVNVQRLRSEVREQMRSQRRKWWWPF